MDKASIYTIAQHAGVSAATVSRTLAGKENVRPETRRRVLEAAKALNYQPNRLARRLSGSEITIAVFCFGSLLKEFYFDIFRGAYDTGRALADYHVRARLCYMPNVKGRVTDQEVDQIVKILDSGVQGAIGVPCFADKAQNARIEAAIQRNNIALADILAPTETRKSVFTYRSDTYTAGAMAAELLWNMLGDGSAVSIFTGQRDMGLHAESIRGFQDAMKRYPLDLRVVYENHDDPQLAYYAADALLRSHPDVRGVFVGSANSLSVCKRIAESPRADEIRIITSDLYSELLPYFDRRMVRATIVQDQYTQTCEAFRALADYLMTGMPPQPSQRMVRPKIVVESNARQYVTSRFEEGSNLYLKAIERY